MKIVWGIFYVLCHKYQHIHFENFTYKPYKFKFMNTELKFVLQYDFVGLQNIFEFFLPKAYFIFMGLYSHLFYDVIQTRLVLQRHIILSPSFT